MRRLATALLLGWAVAPAGLLAQGGGLAVQLAVLVVDQDSRPIEGAQGIVNRLVATTGPDGMLYFAGLAPGQYQLTTRAVGYRVDVQQVAVTDQVTTRVIVKLLPMPLRLPPVIVSAVRPGLYGVVSNTRLEPLIGVEIRLLGRSGRTIRTDSAGRFSYPKARGAYLVRFSAKGHEERRFGVTVPDEGGQEMLVQLGDDPSYEGASNQQRFAERAQQAVIAWSNRRNALTRTDLARYGSSSICDVPAIRAAMRRATRGPMDRACAVRANEVELVVWGANSCFIPSTDESTLAVAQSFRPRNATGPGGVIRNSMGERPPSRSCPPYFRVFAGQ
jgi:hypothetical protein